MTTTTDPETPPPASQPASANWKSSVVISLVIFAAAGGIAAVTFMTEPTAQKEGATKKTAMLVEVDAVERNDYQPLIVATGTVEAAKDIMLRPQISGMITSVSDNFTPGGFVEKGETLVRIESADFRYQLAQRKSDLRAAIADLAVEQGRQDAAKADYEYLGEKLDEERRARVLREPQLDAARERVEAAKAAVDQAKLNVRRTTVEAPFDAHVLTREANIGSQVSTNDTLGRLVGVDEYWVALELPLSKLRWVALPESPAETGSEVRLTNRVSWAPGVERVGSVFKLVGALDTSTRMARLLVHVDDPLAVENSDVPKLMVGEYLEARIHGKTLQNVVRLERGLVRAKDTVWVMNDGKLDVRDVDVVVRDTEYAYVSKGLEDGDKVVTTNLSTVVDGAALRTSSEEETATDEAAADE